MSDIRQLGDIANIVAGFAFSETHQGKSNLPTPFIKVSDFALGKDTWLSTSVNTVDRDILKSLRAKTYPAGTIVFPKVGGALLTNKRARLAVEATFDNNVMGLIPTGVDGNYLFYFMCSFDMAGIANTQSMPSVRASDVSRIEIPVPSPETQRQIAARLKAQLAEVETARQAAQVQLSDTRLLRARMLNAFFAELDAAPKKRLGDYAETTSGSTPSRGNKQYWQPAEIAWVKTGEVAFAPITASEETNSKTALNMLEHVAVDVVITDVYMPGMNGVELVRRISDGGTCRRVICMTGGGVLHTARELLVQARVAGAECTIAKPFTSAVPTWATGRVSWRASKRCSTGVISAIAAHSSESWSNASARCSGCAIASRPVTRPSASRLRFAHSTSAAK